MSIANLLVDNNYDLLCHNLTSSGTVAATSFIGPLLPLGPLHVLSTNDSNGYNDATASFTTLGGISVAKTLNTQDVFINSTNNTAYTPDATCNNLVISGGAVSGLQVNSNNTGTSKMNFGNSTGSTQGGIQYTHSVAGTTDVLNLDIPNAMLSLVGDPVTPTIKCNVEFDVDTINEFTLGHGISMLHNTTVFGTIFSTNIAASTMVIADTDGGLTSRLLTNGEILIGNTGNNPSVGSISGTTDQITVTPGAGTITLSTPQNLNSTADVNFNSVTLTTTGGIAAPLNYYEEVSSMAFTFTGFTSPQTVAISFVRVGKNVTMQLENNINGTPSATTT